MNTWIEHLNSPLVLIAFTLFIFAGVIKLLLKNNIIKVNQVNSAKLINKSLNYVFILSLVGMFFGFFSQEKVLNVVAEKNPLPKSEVVNNLAAENNKSDSEKKEKSANTNTISGSTISGSKINQSGGDMNQ